MKNSFVLFIKYLIPVSVFMLVSSLTGAVITPLFGISMEHISMPGNKETFMGLFTLAVIQTLVLSLLAGRSRLNRKKLGLMLSSVFFSINYLLNTIESLVFVRNIYPVSMQMVNMLNGLILAAAVGYTVAFLHGAKISTGKIPEFNWSRKLILSWTGWTLIWFIIYFCAGFLIPMNIEGVSEYYFSGEGAMDMALVPIGYLLQIPRASIWILLAIVFQKYLQGTVVEKGIITGIVFGCLMSSNLLIPNFIMPDLVRLAHLPEIMFANLLWGIIISKQVSKHFKEG